MSVPSVIVAQVALNLHPAFMSPPFSWWSAAMRGGRLTLQTARGPATLDLWEGNEEGFTDDESRTLAIATSILGLGMR